MYNSEKCKSHELEASIEFSFTVFPKPPAFIQPGKTTFYHPSFRYDSELMHFIALGNFYFSSNQFFYRLCTLRRYRIGIHIHHRAFLFVLVLCYSFYFFNYLPANCLNYLPFLFPCFYKKSAYLSNIECNMSRMVTYTSKMVTYTSKMVSYMSKMVTYTSRMVTYIDPS